MTSEIEDDLTLITDIDLLKFHLKRQRENLTRKMQELLQLDLSYKDLIKRFDYEQLLTTHQQRESEHKYLQNEFQHLGHACLYLINKTHDLIEERNIYANQWKKHRNCLTPRPDWGKVENVIDGGRERWKNLASGKSSEELMDVLIEEISDGNERDSKKEQECFYALGEEQSILPFLRLPKYTRVVNRKMRRRITGILIKEIWTEKIRHAFEDQRPFADQVADYLEKRFDSRSLSIEIGYNLQDACRRYRNSEQINLFWGILTGQIEEMVYHHQIKSISQLFQHLIQMKAYFSRQTSASTNPQARKAIVSSPDTPLSALTNQRLSSLSLLSMQNYHEISAHVAPQRKFLLTDEQFLQSLRHCYPHKTASQINQLYLAAKCEQSIEFNRLFLEDNEGRFSDFLATLLRQLEEEKLAYVEQVKQILLGYPLITVSQFGRAIHMIDPKIPVEELHRYIRWVYSLKTYQPSDQLTPLDFEVLLRRLENCACFQH